MTTEITQRLKQLRISWEADKITSQHYDPATGDFLLYWDESDCKWTIESLAFKGYVISRLFQGVDFQKFLSDNQ